MATTNLVSTRSGNLILQTGNGIPNHIATIGTFYMDLDVGTEYINKNGIALWAEQATSNSAAFELIANKQNSMVYDGTGTKYPTVDAVNIQANNIARATISTGFVDVSDGFTLYKYDDNTLGVSGSTIGIVFKNLFTVPPFAPSAAIVQMSGRTVSLSDINLSANTSAIKFVGYRQSDDSIIFADTTFIKSQTVCQLGVVLVKNVLGTTSFIDDNRTFFNQPDIASYNNLEVTSAGIKSNVIVDHNGNNLRIRNTSGVLIGISVNWHGVNNDLLPIVGSEPTGTTFTYLYPGLFSSVAPLTSQFLIDPTVYWDGSALVSPGNNNTATIQRFLVTIRGTIVVQYGETTYPSFVQAQNNVTIQSFTDVLPVGTFAEVGRLVITKAATDLSDNTKAQFFASGGGNGGGGGSSVATWGTITGNIFDQADLVANFEQKIANNITGTGITNVISKFNSDSGITNSNISDDGSLVMISANTKVIGSITGNSFVKSGGTSNQFLKADGSVDDNTYTTGLFQQNIVVSLSGGKTMGKYTNGQTIPASGKTFEQVLRDIAIEYLTPTFASFSISGQATLIEVGTALSGSKTFTWGFNNLSNVSANTMSIIDVTSGNTALATGISITSPSVQNIGSVSNLVPISQSWRGTAIDTNSNAITSSLFTVNSIYPVFYGVSASAPTANQALINSGTKSVVNSTGTVSITFGASVQYLWFAIPQTSTDKTKWFVDALNNGNIGTGSDLFNNDTIVSVSSPTALWSSVNYRIYISNFATTTSGVMQLQN